MKPVRVLVVDDSAFARQVVSAVLDSSRELEVVGTARDGLEALEKIQDLAPNVITLDLVMPHLDGVGLLQALPAARPAVVVVSMSDRDSALAVHALELGAFDLVHKPTALATERLYEMGDELVAKVRAAAASRGRVATVSSVPPPASSVAREIEPRADSAVRLICIGCSTGGPQALTQLIPRLPPNLRVPVCVVVHMPAGFTESLAARLNELSPNRVVEASHDLRLEPGMIAVAPGGTHMQVVSAPEPTTQIVAEAPGSLYRPSVDLLFTSAASAFGDGVLAVVLTGMGDDGLGGARRIVAAGGAVLTEAAESCVVHGMPRCVLSAGLSSADVPLESMAETIARRL